MLRIRMCGKYFLRNITKNSLNYDLHVPVMLDETVNALNVTDGQTVLDMTFGAGGHSKAILEITKDMNVIALDRDPMAYNIAKSFQEEYGKRVVPLLGRFSELDTLLPQCGIKPECLDAVLLDAGCSSMQFDIPERGFSIKRNGLLDMRMDGERNPLSATGVVNSLNALELQEIFSKYGEEKRSRKISEAIVNYRKQNGKIKTTHELVEAIESSFNEMSLYHRKDALNRRTHPATKVFMALRIFVNDEYNELSQGLDMIEKYLKPGGHLVTISFHSHEDRIIKRKISGITMDKPLNMTLKHSARKSSHPCANKSTNWARIRTVKMPDMKEKHDNPRSRSAKLRIAMKIS